MGSRPLRWDVADHLETRSSPTFYRAKFGRPWLSGTSVRPTENLQKNLTVRVPPFKVNGTDVDRSATYDFLLVIH